MSNSPFEIISKHPCTIRLWRTASRFPPFWSSFGGWPLLPDGTMNFDDILIRLGEFGRYQKILYFLAVCLPGVSCGVFMVISVFLLGVPEHRSVELPFYRLSSFIEQAFIKIIYIQVFQIWRNQKSKIKILYTLSLLN